MGDKIKIVLFANWKIGELTLSALYGIEKVEVLAVFTQYDANNHDPYFNALYYEAQALDITVINTINMKGHELSKSIITLFGGQENIIFLSVAFNKIFKKDVVNMFNIINLHPSALPLYRGPSPVLWAIFKNESEIGLTLHLVDEGIDTGNIITQTMIKLNYQMTFNQLTDLISTEGSRFVTGYISSLDMPINSVPQKNSESYFPRILIKDEHRNLTLKNLQNVLLKIENEKIE